MTVVAETTIRVARPHLAVLDGNHDLPGDGAAVTLARLIAELGPGTLHVVAAPAGLRTAVRRPVIWDASGVTDVGAGDLVLAVGAHVTAPEFTALLERAARDGAAGVVAKGLEGHEEWLGTVAGRCGLAVLCAAPEVTWDWLHGVVRTWAAAGGTGGPAGLFALADAAAANLGGPVEIDDAGLRVLAFSNLGHEIDALRTESILHRGAPESARAWLRESGLDRRIREAHRPLRVVPPDAAPRWVMPVRAGLEILGYLWVSETGTPPGTAHEAALTALARSVATALLRGRATEDVEDRLREGLLRAALTGTGSPRALAAAVEATGGCRLLVLRAAPGLDAPGLSCLRELAGARAGLAGCGLATARIGDRVYVLLGAVPMAAATSLAEDLADRAATQLRTRLSIAIGDEADPACLADARRTADRLLDLAAEGVCPPIAVEAAERSRLFLAELAELIRQRPHLAAGQVGALAELDRTQQTDYIATLRAYFDASCDRAKAAKHLFVHRNTLRYRLQRIQEICGLDLEDPAERLVTELQLRLCEPDRSAGPGIR